jgi:hypothetical protein
MSRTKFNHAYHNSNDLVAFDEFADQIMTLPRAELKPLYYNEQVIDESTGIQELKPSRFNAVVSEDGQEQYASVSKSYTLAQHQDVMFQVLNTIQSAGIDGNARIKSFGGRAYMDMVFSNMQIADPTGTSINLGYTARNTYDSTGAINLFPFCIRSICSNGSILKMSPDLHLNVISIKHMGDIELKVREGIKQLITNTLKVKDVFITMIEKATNNVMEFTANELELTLSEYTGSRFSARKIIESSTLNIAGENSQWDLYNSLTQYASWNVQSGPAYERIEAAAEKLLNHNSKELEASRTHAIAIEAARETRRNEHRTIAPLTI